MIVCLCVSLISNTICCLRLTHFRFVISLLPAFFFSLASLILVVVFQFCFFLFHFVYSSPTDIHLLVFNDIYAHTHTQCLSLSHRFVWLFSPRRRALWVETIFDTIFTNITVLSSVSVISILFWVLTTQFYWNVRTFGHNKLVPRFVCIQRDETHIDKYFRFVCMKLKNYFANERIKKKHSWIIKRHVNKRQK